MRTMVSARRWWWVRCSMPTFDDNAFNEGIALDTGRARGRDARPTASTRRSSASPTASTRRRRPERVRDRAPGRHLGLRASRRPRRMSPTSTGCSSCRGCSGCSSASSPSRPSAMRWPPACAVAGTTSGSCGRSASWAETCCGRSRRSPGRSWPSGLAFGIPLGHRRSGRVAWQVVADRIGVRAVRPDVTARCCWSSRLLACLAAAALSRPARRGRGPAAVGRRLRVE